jgi:IclR family transcriptional regulator, KDG regulon repressor
MRLHVKNSRPTNSLERALAILELVAYKSGGLTNAAIAARMKMATSTTSYILSRLEREGFLQRQPDTGRYEIGLKLVALGHSALRDMGLRRVAEPVLWRFVAETKASALVGVLERGRLMIVDKVERPDMAAIDMDIGVRYPVHLTALGKAMLAHLPEERLHQVFESYDPGNTSVRTTERHARLLEELRKVRKLGYAKSDGDLYIGVRAIAAPIFGPYGEARAAVSATGFSVSIDDPGLIAAVKTAAHEISRRLAEAQQQKPRL